MIGIYVDFSTINRRKNALLSEKTTSAKPNKYIVENALKNKRSPENSLLEYANHLYDNFSLSNECFGDFMDLLASSTINEDCTVNRIVNEAKNRILPYLEDMDTAKQIIESAWISDYQRNTLIEAANKYIVADKILRNYNSISEKFDIDKECMRYNADSSKFSSVVENCFNFFNDYSIAPYQKLNIMIEEMSYVFNKNGIEYNELDLVKECLKNFMLNETDYTDKDMINFTKAINSGYCINNETKKAMRETIVPATKSKVTFESIYQSFIYSPEKTLDLLRKTVKELISYSFDVLVDYGIKKILYLLWDCYKNDLFYEDKMHEFIIYSVKDMANFITGINYKLISSEYFQRASDQFVEVYKSISIPENLSDDYIRKARNFLAIVRYGIDTISDFKDIAYNHRNILNINYVNNSEQEALPLKEFKIFKFHNLFAAAIRADKQLKEKIKQKNTKVKAVFKKTREMLFPENTEIYSFIGEDGKADICVAQFEFTDESEINEFVQECCKSINSDIELNDPNTTARAYYVINPGVAEIRIKDATPVEMNQELEEAITNAPKYDMDIYIENFAYMAAILEAFGENDFSDIQDRLVKAYSDEELYDKDVYDLAMEAISLTSIPDNIVNVFAESQGIDSPILEREENVPLDVQLEAYQILDALLEDGMKKPKVGAAALKKKPVSNNIKDTVEVKPNKDKDLDNKNNDNESKSKNPFNGVNINTLKIYLQGLKKKVKDMSQKEKELSRNLDNAFRRLVKASKDALISDRREAIIKGSVIPSFSKCIKIAIALAGEGLIFGNPVVPLLTFLGGLAMSKNLTKKERILLLDEIDTELEVVEKEIANAESKNQMKKYRALLKYKKDLQRQYQRIRYNVKVGKDILPDSTTGLKNND